MCCAAPLPCCSYGLDLFLLSIDEGISGYRDDSLETVKRNEQTYGIPLKVRGGCKDKAWPIQGNVTHWLASFEFGVMLLWHTGSSPSRFAVPFHDGMA